MKKMKILITLLIICTFVSLLITTSYAADTFSASMTPSSSKVTKGDEFTITIKLSRINITDGLATFRGTLKFDKDVVTMLEANGQNNWSVTYNDTNNTLLFDTATATKTDVEIGTLKFKMNDSTSALTAAIRLVSIEGGNAALQDPVKISDITTNVSVGGGVSTQTPTTTPTGNDATNTNATVWPTTKPSNSPVNIPTSSPSLSPTVVVDTPSPSPANNTPKNTTTNDNMPNTGAADGYIIPLMAFIATLGIISFVNYKKLSEK